MFSTFVRIENDEILNALLFLYNLFMQMQVACKYIIFLTITVNGGSIPARGISRIQEFKKKSFTFSILNFRKYKVTVVMFPLKDPLKKF
jgi:hypothetical protein